MNSDSHHNYDPDRGGENADGFGSHSNDDGNVFIGNRAWENSDDGYDFINSDGRVELIESWAWRNGFVPGTNMAAGNGAGIKAGGYGLESDRFPSPEDVPTNLIQGNLSFDNRVQGFYANHHPGGIDWINNTSFDNPRGFDLLNDVDPEMWPADHYLRNNISFANNADLFNANQALIDDEFNTWNARLGASASDFVSLDWTGVDGPRQLDGSLPELDFMRLAAGSDLIDAGVDVGSEFNGTAPDLGAFEFFPGQPGDVDGDGEVDIADLDLILANFRQGPSTRSMGDLTGDGVVDLFDFREWKANYPDALPEPFAFGAQIPKPNTLVAALLAMVAWPIKRMRRTKWWRCIAVPARPRAPEPLLLQSRDWWSQAVQSCGWRSSPSARHWS